MDPKIGVWITSHALTEAEARAAVATIVRKADLVVQEESLADEQPFVGVMWQAFVSFNLDVR